MKWEEIGQKKILKELLKFSKLGKSHNFADSERSVDLKEDKNKENYALMHHNQTEN